MQDAGAAAGGGANAARRVRGLRLLESPLTCPPAARAQITRSTSGLGCLVGHMAA